MDKSQVTTTLPIQKKGTGCKGKASANFISDGPVKRTKTRQRRKHTRRLPYYGTMVEKKENKTTLCAADVG